MSPSGEARPAGCGRTGGRRQESGRPVGNGFRSVLVIWNAVAGLDTQERDRAALERFLEERDVRWESVDWDPSVGMKDSIAGADRKGVDVIVAAGGDGTASAVADCMVRCECSLPMALMPTGSSNMLASGLGYPAAPEDALEAAWGGRVERMDVGYVAELDRTFLMSISIGMHADIVRRTSREAKRKLGCLAYALTGVGTLLRTGLMPVSVMLGSRRYRFRTDNLLVLNTADFLPAEESLSDPIEPDDGMLDLVVMRTGSLLDVFGLLLHALVGKRYRPYRTEHRKVCDITVRTRRPMAVQLDGESVGETPVTVEVMPGALPIVVPEGD